MISSDKHQQSHLFPSAPPEISDALSPDWAPRTYAWITSEMASGKTVRVSTYTRATFWTPAVVTRFRKQGIEPFKLDLLGDLRMFEGWNRREDGTRRPRYVCLVNTVGIQTY